MAINDSGQVLGWSKGDLNGTKAYVERAFLLASGQMTDIGVPPTWSQIMPAALNNSGVAVGTGYTSAVGQVAGQYAFVYNNGVMADLNTLAGTTGWVLQYATAVNDSGQIVGWGLNPQGFSRGFLLDPGAEAGPVITAQPQTQTVKTGVMLTLSVTATETPSPTYQWQKNGVAITGATLSKLLVPGVRSFDGGNYTVVVANQAGAVTSNVAVVSVTNPTAPVYYRVTDLGTLAPPAVVGTTYPYGINNAGQIVGVSKTAAGLNHAFLYANGTMSDLGTLPGGGNSTAYAINNAGQIVGTSETATTTRAFIYSGGQLKDLGPGLAALPLANGSARGSTAMWLNNAGQFVWGTGTLAAYSNGLLAANDYSFAGGFTGINGSGQLIGSSGLANSAMIYTNGVYTALGSLNTQEGGNQGYNYPTLAVAINDSGQVLGWSKGDLNGTKAYVERAFLWANGQMTDIGVPPTWSQIMPAALNNSGVAVGTGYTGAVGQVAGQYAFVYSNGVMADLNTMVAASGLVLRYATAINDNGQIVGWGTNSGGAAHAFLLTPTVGSPTISVQPQSIAPSLGGAATLTVTATGSPSPTYQWLKNGAAVSGATNATLNFSAVQAADGANYTVAITNSTGTVTSAIATLTVNPPATIPVFTTQPLSQVGVVGNTLTLSAVVGGFPIPTYQWKINGVVVPGAIGSSFTIGSLQASDAASYTVVATNSVGSVTSNAAVLTVNSPPVIITQPTLNALVVEG